MRAILVTLSEILPQAVSQVLSFNIEYSAVIVDNPESARHYVVKTGGYADVVHPFHEMKKCIENLEYDYIVCVTDYRNVHSLPQKVRSCGVSKNKFIHIYLAKDGNHPQIIRRALRYFKKYHKNFDMFATGMSYTSFGLDSTRFKRNLFNFAKASQDLYYDYQIAKFAIDTSGGGGYITR